MHNLPGNRPALTCSAIASIALAKSAARRTAPDRDEAFLDRALGCLLGGAIGDGFGYALELGMLSDIHARFGPEGLREPVLNECQLRVSDAGDCSPRQGRVGEEALAIALDAVQSLDGAILPPVIRQPLSHRSGLIPPRPDQSGL